MVNGLAVLGWGAGVLRPKRDASPTNLDAVPDVIGFALMENCLKATATDLVL